MSYKLANKFGRGSGILPTFLTDTFVGDTDVDPVTDLITVTATPLTDGLPVKLSGGTQPVGLITGNVYFVLEVDVNTIQLARYPGGPAVNITADGAGTNTLTEVEIVEFPRNARIVSFMVNGTNVLVRYTFDSLGKTQLWQDWTAGAVSVLTDATFQGGFQQFEISGAGTYSYNWD